MDMFWVVILWVINFAISWWNARVVGLAWVETKHCGGWVRFMAWLGAIMSASGFTWCFTILFMLGAHFTGFLSEKQALVGLQVGYLMVIPFILFSGMGIMLDSWARAYRERTVSSGAVAAYDTFAQIYNTYHAIEGIGDAFGSVLDFFKSDSKSSSSDDDNNSAAGLLILLLVVLAAVGGIMLTASIIKSYAGSYDMPGERW